MKVPEMREIITWLIDQTNAGKLMWETENVYREWGFATCSVELQRGNTVLVSVYMQVDSEIMFAAPDGNEYMPDVSLRGDLRDDGLQLQRAVLDQMYEKGEQEKVQEKAEEASARDRALSGFSAAMRRSAKKEAE
jgi:hypothetical protein